MTESHSQKEYPAKFGENQTKQCGFDHTDTIFTTLCFIYNTIKKEANIVCRMCQF